MVRKHHIGGNERISDCPDVLSGGRRNVSLSADLQRGQPAAEMLLHNLYTGNHSDARFCRPVHSHARAERHPQRNIDFPVVFAIPVYNHSRKYPLLDFAADIRQEEKSRLRAEMAELEIFCSMHPRISCSLLRPGYDCLCHGWAGRNHVGNSGQSGRMELSSFYTGELLSRFCGIFR